MCASLPETTEKEAWGAPTFRVNNKLFAMYSHDHHGDGRIAVWCKARPEDQGVFVSANPEVFFVPPYVGPSGWIGVRLDRDLPWEEVGEILAEAHRLIAPKRLLARMDAEAGDGNATPSAPSPSKTRGGAKKKAAGRKKGSGGSTSSRVRKK